MGNQKRVYTFGAGKAEGRADMRNELGGKGANLAEMNLIGVPVPPGFTITTDTCNDYYRIGKQEVVDMLKAEVDNALHHIEDLWLPSLAMWRIPSFSPYALVRAPLCLV